MLASHDGCGRIYVVTTIVSCVTGLGIFHHGGFGAPHELSLMTLAVLGVAALAGHSTLFGHASRYVETVSYSATFFFHFIPGITETSTLYSRSAAGGQCRRTCAAGGDRGVVRRVPDRCHAAGEAVARCEPGVVDLIGHDTDRLLMPRQAQGRRPDGDLTEERAVERRAIRGLGNLARSPFAWT